MKSEMHEHKYKVTDYSDSDPGILHVECECGNYRKAVNNQEDYDFYSADGYEPDLLLLPDVEGLDEILDMDMKALGLK